MAGRYRVSAIDAMTTPGQASVTAPVRGLARIVTIGAAWMLALRWSDRLIALGSIVVLARLLDPADFGVVGYAVLLTGILDLLTRFSTDAALIRDQSRGRGSYDGAWTINIVRGFGVGLMVAALAAPTAAYLGEPRLEAIMYWLALVPLLHGFENVGTVDFRKHLEFSRQFAFRLVTRLVATAMTLGLALAWRDYWALVVGMLVHCAVSLAASYALHPFRPRLSVSGMRGILRFSGWLALQDLIQGVTERLPSLLVARFADATALAFLTTAREVADMAITELRAPIRAALYPGFAKIAHEGERLRAALLDATGILALVSLPIPLGIALTAADAVPLVLGAKWLPIVPVLEILGVGGALSALSTNSHLVLLALNRPHLVTLVAALRLIVLAPAAFVLIPAHGPLGAAYALLAATSAVLAADYALSAWRLAIAPRRFVAVVWRPLLAAIAMAIVVQALRGWIGPSATAAEHVTHLVLCAAVGAAVYAAGVLALWRLVGIPDGAERRMISLLKSALRRVPGHG